ncbi:hypothetical protein FC758_12385 [Clostridium botulinum]|nr:hypothetical protein [Clostridium botulinum]NFL62578.1 hypothetical protein [Clostridium botulinum]
MNYGEIDLNQERISNLKKFQEEKAKYNLKTVESYGRKIQEFNKAMDYDETQELQKMKLDINKNFTEIRNKINKEKLERDKLEENLKFDLAEEKDNTISSLQHELENYNSRLSIVQGKIKEEKESIIKNIAKKAIGAAQDYRNELETVIENARIDLKDRYNKILEEHRNFNENYCSVSYEMTEVEDTIRKLNKYI